MSGRRKGGLGEGRGLWKKKERLSADCESGGEIGATKGGGRVGTFWTAEGERGTGGGRGLGDRGKKKEVRSWGKDEKSAHG